MGVRSVYQITDPAFSEFVYYKMINCPPEIRGRLNPSELRYFRSKKVMRSFADNETLERRLVLLTRMGVQFTVALYSDKADLDLAFKEYDENYYFAKKNVDLLNIMRKGNLFVFGSRSLMMMNLLEEQGCHSQGYILDYQYMRTTKLLTGLRELRRETKIADAEQTYSDLARVITTGISCFNEYSPKDGVSDVNMRILLILLTFRNSFVTGSTIKHRMGVAQTSAVMSRVMNMLVKDGLAYEANVPDMDWQRKAYTISEKGLDRVMNFLKYVQQQLLDMN